MNVVLIGYRGSGKTTVAQQLALRLGWDWVDADVEVELRAGKSIRAIFDEDGEAAFRDAESRVLVDLASRQRTVIAAGGGAILRESNRRALRSAARVVWLRASVESMLARIADDHTTAARRPNLTSAGGETEMRQLLAVREPLYRETAEVAIDTDGKSPAAIAAEIVMKLQIA